MNYCETNDVVIYVIGETNSATLSLDSINASWALIGFDRQIKVAMGVKDLWPMLESVKKPKQFREMEGETLAVDLSMWIVDSQCVKQMAGTVTRPHLR